MRRRLLQWWYGRRLDRALSILQELAERHTEAGHEAYFKADRATNIHFYCVKCPEMQPPKRRPEDAVTVYRDQFGRPFYG